MKSHNQIMYFFRISLGVLSAGVLVIALAGAVTPARADEAGPTPAPAVGESPWFTVQQVETAGMPIEKVVIAGPPQPPAGFEEQRAPISLDDLQAQAGSKSLTAPAYSWVFGCSAVSSAMIVGYYDRNGYPNMYTGPTNGGVAPLAEDPAWGGWTDSASQYYPYNPLVASHNGVDGVVGYGSLEDYWVSYGSLSVDPYITASRSQHSYVDAVGDFLGTSQSALGNTDGSTVFYSWTSSPARLTCDDMVTNSITNDGTYGRRSYFIAHGYTVTDCYNRKTDNNETGGFSFADYMAEIDTGQPVLINLAGHSIVGVGYDSASSTMYVHDTWDNSDHLMTWGGSYSGMDMLSVSVVHLAPLSPVGSKPTGSITDPTPIFEWKPVIGATSYILQLYKGTTKIHEATIAYTACTGSKCTYTLPAAKRLADGVYKWHVKSVGGGVSSANSADLKATLLTVPVQNKPSGNVIGTKPGFEWKPVSGATQYKIYVYKGTSTVSGYPKTIASSACTATLCKNTPAVTLAKVTYTWKIQAYVDGVWRPLSAAKSFTVK